MDEMTDWSEIMTALQKNLKLAEDSLRMIHVGDSHRSVARMCLMKAQEDLEDLLDWTDE